MEFFTVLQRVMYCNVSCTAAYLKVDFLVHAPTAAVVAAARGRSVAAAVPAEAGIRHRDAARLQHILASERRNLLLKVKLSTPYARGCKDWTTSNSSHRQAAATNTGIKHKYPAWPPSLCASRRSSKMPRIMSLESVYGC